MIRSGTLKSCRESFRALNCRAAYVLTYPIAHCDTGLRIKQGQIQTRQFCSIIINWEQMQPTLRITAIFLKTMKIRISWSGLKKTVE
jgi:hypothetical protein